MGMWCYISGEWPYLGMYGSGGYCLYGLYSGVCRFYCNMSKPYMGMGGSGGTAHRGNGQGCVAVFTHFSPVEEVG